jgi:hypothetical protein
MVVTNFGLKNKTKQKKNKVRKEGRKSKNIEE